MLTARRRTVYGEVSLRIPPVEAPALGRPLVCHRQPDRDYRQDPAISQSEAKELLKSPAHYQARYGPNAEPFYPTPAMLFGSAVHHRTLEPETFADHWCSKAEYGGEPTIPELKKLLTDKGVPFKATAKKAELLELAYPEGVPTDSRCALSEDDWRHVHGIHAALRSHDYTGMWFDPGQKDYSKFNELSIYSKTHQGHLIKGRLDRAHIQGNKLTILDLKTTDKADARSFQRKLVDLRYDLQASWYTRLAAEAFASLEVEFIFIAIERKPPYGICLYRASESIIEHGNRLMDKALNIFGERMAIDDWPAYPPEIVDLELPSWESMQQDEQCLEF